MVDNGGGGRDAYAGQPRSRDFAASEGEAWSAACGCTFLGRCAEGNALWEAANAVYRGSGYDAWIKALEPYNDHIAAHSSSADVLLPPHYQAIQ